jgi:hypothetical protein
MSSPDNHNRISVPGAARNIHRKPGYIPTLDGWRAVAILAVLVSHDRTWLSTSWIHNLGRQGVDLFFCAKRDSHMHAVIGGRASHRQDKSPQFLYPKNIPHTTSRADISGMYQLADGLWSAEPRLQRGCLRCISCQELFPSARECKWLVYGAFLVSFGRRALLFTISQLIGHFQKIPSFNISCSDLCP